MITLLVAGALWPLSIARFSYAAMNGEASPLWLAVMVASGVVLGCSL